MQNLRKKIIPWIKTNTGRLLLFAVIITGCFSVKNAAYGKYVDYLRDYTSVTSAPFYFSSNYLGEVSEDKQYEINTFDGQNFEFDVEIRNFDNAYLFNEKGKDVYYYVTTELYEDEDYSTPFNPEGYTTTIKYGKTNEYAAGMAKAVRVYEQASPGETATTSQAITIDLSNQQYNDEDAYKLVGRLDGLEGSTVQGKTAADITSSSRIVHIKLRLVAAYDRPVYLKVIAHTMPPVTTSNTPSDGNDDTCITKVTDSAKTDFGENLFPSGYVNAITGNSSCPDVISGYENAKGIYASELVGKFALSKGSSGGSIQRTDFYVNNYTYEVYYTFTCDETVQAKLSYPKDSLVPDANLGTVYDKDTDHPYVLVDIFANGSKTCYFYKKTLSTTVTKDDVTAEIYTGS